MNRIQLNRIDLNLLVSFEALMEEGSVAAAADRLGLTPSAVSHALRRLRTQLGDPLLVRVGGKMQPTAHALLLIEELRPVLRGRRRVLAPPEHGAIIRRSGTGARPPPPGRICRSRSTPPCGTRSTDASRRPTSRGMSAR